jgi:glycosyltransferase involved in cell wall biosynthesis
MKIAGDGSDSYGKKIHRMIEGSIYKKDIEYLGRVGDDKKIELMQKSSLILVTSVKEGWGLIVTEANSQGTPAVVYDVDGLRDSVRHNETGIITTENTPESLAEALGGLLRDQKKHAKMRHNAWEWSKTLSLEKTTEEFKDFLFR